MKEIQTDSLKIEQLKTQLSNSKEFYDKLLENQTIYFENLLTTVGIITTILVVIVTVFNVYVSREILKKDAKRLYEKEQDKLQKQFLSEVNQMGKISEYTMHINAANFYITSIIPGKQFLAINHYFKALKIAIEDLHEDNKIIDVMHDIITSIDIKSTEEFNSRKLNAKQMKEKAKVENYNLEEFKSILNSVPDNSTTLKNLVLKKLVQEGKN